MTATSVLTLPIRVRDLLPGDVFLDPRDPAGQIRYEVNTLPAPRLRDIPDGMWAFRATGLISGQTRTHAYLPHTTLEVIA